jgi:hypothetical protein
MIELVNDIGNPRENPRVPIGVFTQAISKGRFGF